MLYKNTCGQLECLCLFDPDQFGFEHFRKVLYVFIWNLTEGPSVIPYQIYMNVYDSPRTVVAIATYIPIHNNLLIAVWVSHFQICSDSHLW